MMPIVRGPNKAARALQRADLGPLRLQLMQPARRRRNIKAAGLFLVWTMYRGYPHDSCNAVLDAALLAWAENLWLSGDGKDGLADTLYGVRMLVGGPSLNLQDAWQLYKQWSKAELPQQAPPMLLLELLGLAGMAAFAGAWGLACSLLVGFDCFLRPSEFLDLKPTQVSMVSGAAVLDLGETKGVKRRGGKDEVILRDPLLVGLLGKLCLVLPPDEPLSGVTLAQGREWVKKALARFDLGQRGLQLYSIRRGGVTRAYTLGASATSLSLRARWMDAKTARVYIAEGKELLRNPQLTDQQRGGLQWCADYLARHL